MLWTIIAATALLLLTYAPGVIVRYLGVGRLRRQSRGKLVLTYDDGPAPVPTPQILDMLDRHRARATFFVLGNQVAKHPEMLRSHVQAGHELARTATRTLRLERSPALAPDITRGIEAVSRWQRVRAIIASRSARARCGRCSRRAAAGRSGVVDGRLGDSWVASPSADPVVARARAGLGRRRADARLSARRKRPTVGCSRLS